MRGVGLCAVFSRQGDWAFDYAMKLARHHKAKLSIFQFLESPYSLARDADALHGLLRKEVALTPELIMERDKELRFRHDDRLDDYTDVGFRICEGGTEDELNKCFNKGEYEVLVIGYQGKGADFGGKTTIEAFAGKFKGPLVLVGPDAPDHFVINLQAKQIVDILDLPDGKWELLSA